MNVQEWLGENNKLGIDIWNKKYRHNNESFDEWLDRISAGDQELKNLIKEKKFLLGGRALANRGVENAGSYFNCYSRGFVKDDHNDIADAYAEIAKTFKSQGGQGLSLSKLRPKGTPITGGYFSDGIIPFMTVYNSITAATKQGGSRKGALMMSVDARHKEVEDFIKIKTSVGMIEEANLSLEIDDEFMQAVKKYYDIGEIVVLHEKRNYSGHSVEYDVVPIKIYKMLIEASYDWGEPACLYVNKFRNYNLMQFDNEYQIETCNPCGEQPLPRHGACCLASINLSEFVKNPYTKEAEFDMSSFFKAVGIGVQTLDKLIDENYYRHPLKEQQEMSYNYRNIGLGVFGYATMLMKLGMAYGSNVAIEFTSNLFSQMFRQAVIASNQLSKEKGSFPKYKDCVWESDIIKKHFTADEIEELKKYGLRNCSLLSIAPTGSLSSLLGESGGLEPEFAIKYTRRTIGMTDGKDSYYDVYCKAATEYMTLYNTNTLPDYFVSSSDIKWQDRIDTQAAIQISIDTAISSTINLPNNISIDTIEKLYLYAWVKGLKGITIFRDGCKRVGILTTNNTPSNIETPPELPRGYTIAVDEDLIGYKRKLITGCGSIHFEEYFDEEANELRETFINIGSGGGCERNYQFISRLMSLAVRSGVPVEAIIDQAMSIRPCNAYVNRTKTKGDTSKGTSCPSAIGYALKDLQDKINATQNKKAKVIKETVKEVKLTHTQEKTTCPECGEPLTFEGGCNVCKSCGWTKCE